MSDTKWRKLISALKGIPSIDHYFWKSIRGPAEMSGFGYLSANAPHKFIDTFSYGPIYLREIEWFEFPTVIAQRTNGPTPAGGHLQDLAALRCALKSIGHFPVEETPRGLRIVGHIRNAT